MFGIFVRPGGVATGNVANSNAVTGISASQATISNNTANNNGQFGIDASCPAALVGNTTVGNDTLNIKTTGVCTLADNAQ